MLDASSHRRRRASRAVRRDGGGAGVDGRSGARTNAPRDRDGLPIPTRRVPPATIGPCSPPAAASPPILLAGAARPAARSAGRRLRAAGPAPVVEPPVTPEVLAQAELDLVTLTNRQRAQFGLVALRMDPDLMAIARARAEVMAANDEMSHTEPDGRKVFDRLNDAGSPGSAPARSSPGTTTRPSTPTAEAISAWMASPGHHDIMVSTGYNYVGFGAAVSADRQALLRRRLRPGTRRDRRLGEVRDDLQAIGRSPHTRVTHPLVRRRPRLQVLTAGLRYYQVQRRRVGGAWYSWKVTTATHRTVTWSKAYDHEVRVRARDRAGNWGPWKTITSGSDPPAAPQARLPRPRHEPHGPPDPTTDRCARGRTTMYYGQTE